MKYNDYKEILKKYEKEQYFLWKLEIVDNLESFENSHLLEDYEKERFLDYVSYYWFKSDLEYNSLFDVCYLAYSHFLYEIKDYDRFSEALDELV